MNPSTPDNPDLPLSEFDTGAVECLVRATLRKMNALMTVVLYLDEADPSQTSIKVLPTQHVVDAILEQNLPCPPDVQNFLGKERTDSTPVVVFWKNFGFLLELVQDRLILEFGFMIENKHAPDPNLN